jgi:hypothetical protein
MHYFSCSGGTSTGSIKSGGICYSELVFLHPVVFVGHVMHFGASGVRNIDALFFILQWAQCSFHKKRIWTRYVELVFLHEVRTAGHVMHSGASGAQNIDALFSMLRWDR